jgi:hypothetical protein
MTHQTAIPHIRPLPAALALGFAGAALVCLLLRELGRFFAGHEPAIAAALTLLPLCLPAGAALARRLATRYDPADLLPPLLGILAVTMPTTLLALRAVRPFLAAAAGSTLSAVSILGAGTLAFAPLGLCLGGGLQALSAATARRPDHRGVRPAVMTAAAGCAGALFVVFVALPKLSPVNACLDMAIGACAAGLLCAVGVPGGRRAETWLSLLAVCFVFALPLSGLIDARSDQWGPAPTAAGTEVPPTRPAASPRNRPGPAVTGLALVLALGLVFPATRQRKIVSSPLAASAAAMAESAAILAVFFGGHSLGVLPADRQGTLLAAFMAGEALGLWLGGRLHGRAPSPRSVLAMAGPILGLAGVTACWQLTGPLPPVDALAACLAMALGAGGLGGLFRAATTVAPSPLATAAGLAALALALL